MAAQAKIAADFHDSVRRLNFLAKELNAQHYLEVGLGNGGTFDNVEVAHKIGVDPSPWNPAVRSLPGVHCVTSDEYFYSQWDSGTKFDLILLDGLHTAEQTYRDFINSLHFAHAKTVWLIDDVTPSDVFSSVPDHSTAASLRKAATGADDMTWQGDVFKVVWMIKAFHPNMTLKTFRANQGQSLVYYSGAKNVKAPGLTLPEIGNLTYLDTLQRRAEYNLADETDILGECVAAIRKRSR